MKNKLIILALSVLTAGTVMCKPWNPWDEAFSSEKFSILQNKGLRSAIFRLIGNRQMRYARKNCPRSLYPSSEEYIKCEDRNLNSFEEKFLKAYNVNTEEKWKSFERCLKADADKSDKDKQNKVFEKCIDRTFIDPTFPELTKNK